MKDVSLARGQCELWIERAYSRLGLPFSIGAAIVGFLPFLVGIIAIGTTFGFAAATTGDIRFLPGAFIWIMYCQLAARFSSRRIQSIAKYAESMSKDESHVALPLLCDLKGTLVVWLPLLSVTTVLFGYSAVGTSASLTLDVLISRIVWVYPVLFNSLYMWTLAYSMFKIYQIGKIELMLRSFAEDRSLGLKPFAVESFRLTLVYVGFVTIIVLFSAPQGFSSLPFLIFYLGLFLFGIVLFLLPLWSLHDRLVRFKNHNLRAIGQRYALLLKEFEENSETRLEGTLASSLIAIDKVQRDIHQIRTWPFDAGIVAKLAAIMVSVIAILLSRIVALWLNI